MAKITVIHHSADFDGLFCREIARKFIPNAELIGWDFGDAPLDSSLLHSDKVIIMDLPVDRVFGLQFKDGWICRGAEQLQPIDRWDSSNLTWIDHHKSSIESHPATIPGYRIDGVAACRLAWQWFTAWNRYIQQADATARDLAWFNAKYPLAKKQDFVERGVLEPLAVRLAGEYDIWDKRDPRAEVLQFGLRSRELDAENWTALLTPSEINADVDDLLQDGALLQRYQQQTDASVVNHRSFLVEFDGLKFLALNTARCNSLTFAAKDVPETGHDALMGFYWNGKAWAVSLYHANHRKDLDLSRIAVNHGGGGHRGACGFQSQYLPWLLPTIRDGKCIPQTLDARKWASDWIETTHRRPEIHTDEGAMIGWFANAIMAGYDEGCRRSKAV